ncbi:hypothetical protein OPT61_g9068 [Boeremia exigua]|uniref:Uncharacterized protein n=1 Tax=Boeremia exigua TaxID=749465 RepID=A0ACC2HW81_9PLEO|nr:hypothetical protein OPT61_g9068 [Boeremia exigua]
MLSSRLSGWSSSSMTSERLTSGCRDAQTAQLEGDGGVAQALELLLEEAVDVEGAVVEHFGRLAALGGEEHAAQGQVPLGGPLLLARLELAVVEEAAAVDRLAARVDGERQGADLGGADVEHDDGGGVGQQVDHADVVDAAVQALDLLLDVRQALPRQAAAVLGAVGVRVFDHLGRGGAARLVCAMGPVGPAGLLARLLAQGLEVDGDLELGQHDAGPRRLGKGGAVEGEAEAANVDAQAIFGGEGDAAQARVAQALDGHAGDDADEGEEHEAQQPASIDGRAARGLSGAAGARDVLGVCERRPAGHALVVGGSSAGAARASTRTRIRNGTRSARRLLDGSAGGEAACAGGDGRMPGEGGAHATTGGGAEAGSDRDGRFACAPVRGVFTACMHGACQPSWHPGSARPSGPCGPVRAPHSALHTQLNTPPSLHCIPGWLHPSRLTAMDCPALALAAEECTEPSCPPSTPHAAPAAA